MLVGTKTKLEESKYQSLIWEVAKKMGNVTSRSDVLKWPKKSINTDLRQI